MPGGLADKRADVGDADLDLSASTRRRDADRATLRRVLQRVLDEVGEDLVDPVAIRVDRQPVRRLDRDRPVGVLTADARGRPGLSR